MSTHITFPNACGLERPGTPRVRQAQQRWGFSSALADFLQTQNGFFIEDPVGAALQALKSHASEPADPDAGPEGRAGWRYLFGLDAPHDFLDLDEQAEQLAIFGGVFLPIGVDQGGNPLVEVLAGPHKGWVGSLDHELFASSDSFDELASELELDAAAGDSPDDKARALCDEELGLVWWHAASLEDFLARALHLDDEGVGYVVDLVDDGELD